MGDRKPQKMSSTQDTPLLEPADQKLPDNLSIFPIQHKIFRIQAASSMDTVISSDHTGYDSMDTGQYGH